MMIIKDLKATSQSSEENIVAQIRQILSESVVEHRTSLGNCDLNDEESFHNRVSTFTSFSWSFKPKQISPPLCARFGWKVVDKDLMQCTSCKQFLSAEIPQVWNVKTYAEAVIRLEKSLKSSHHPFCPWPNNPSPKNYLQYKLLQRERAIEDLKLRITDLNSFARCLHQLSDCGISDEDVQLICSGIDEKTERNSIVLAVTGWRKVKDSLQRISCDYCLRNVELSLYLPQGESKVEPGVNSDKSQETVISSNVESTDCESPPKAKKLRKCEARPFHPLEQHQTWCPWLQNVFESCFGAEKIANPGWKVLLNIARAHQTIKSSSCDNSSTTRQDVLAVKKIIKDWIVEPSK